MRKSLLMAAATLAAGVISSQAGVYSQNIVGYVNTPAPAGYTAMAAPLDYGNGDSATNFLDTTSGAEDGNLVLTWAGTHFNSVQVDSGSGTGFSNPSTSAPVPAPILAPGTGFLYNNQNGSNTITFTGTVFVNGAGVSTNVVGVTTNILSNATTYVVPGSVLPIGGGITSVLGLSNPGGALDGCLILIPVISSGGAISGYQQVQFDSGSGTGFSNPSTSAPVPEPVIKVGQSFLFSNQSGAPVYWVQSL